MLSGVRPLRALVRRPSGYCPSNEVSEISSPAVRVGTVRSGTSRISQVVTLVAVVVPPFGVLAAMGVLWEVAFHPGDLALMVAMYVVCAFGITVGFHRYFTHRGFKTRAPVKAALAILGCMTMQGPLTQWVTDHRKHHAFSDQRGRPALADGGTATARRRGQGLRARARRLDVHEHGHGAGARVRQGPVRGPARPHDRPALPALGAGDARDPVRDRLRARRLGARPRGDALGRPRPDLPLPARDLLRQLALPHVREARLPARATSRATTGSSRCSSSARGGTTTTTRSPPRRATGCAASSSTSRGG